jgi:hypothetical protein
LNVVIDPQQYGITAGDVEISFDPDVLEGIDIQPGLLMGSNVIMAKRTIDNTNGKLRLAVGREGALPVWSIPTSEGTIAEAELKVLDGVSPQTVTVTISFIGLANQNFEDVPGIITSSATVKVQ